ncbi:hypothetical protein GA0061071_1263 [Kosakonia oryzendophytica]|uniref:Uncharacterized protein n=1 Tax=Kosakonia oryzendophytica TaxID=1005665 RepID=A0A1C4EF95_9ENTR|nr:hypothetical protein [Kosakonia oryzendophytica]SCC42211.1 hypothetical protein GA0061071_1263 [Kosakonia oryzendophytica]
MIGNNNDDYDDYAYDEDTKTVPLSCEDDEDYLRDKDKEEKSLLQKMIEYKDESSLFGCLYEVSGVIGLAILLFTGFVFTLPILLVISLFAFFLTMKEKKEKRDLKNGV